MQTRQLKRWNDQKRTSMCPFCGHNESLDEYTYYDEDKMNITCSICSNEFYAPVEVEVYIHEGYACQDKIIEWKKQNANNNYNISHG